MFFRLWDTFVGPLNSRGRAKFSHIRVFPFLKTCETLSKITCATFASFFRYMTQKWKVRPTLEKTKISPEDMPTFTCTWILIIRMGGFLQFSDMRNFTCGFPPAREVEGSLGMMINDERMWNLSANENDYEIFPLASIFDPPILN